MRRSILIALLSCATLVACEKPREKAEEIKREADKQAAGVASQTNQKLNEAKRKADEAAKQIQKDAQQKTDQIRQAAEKKTTEAGEALAKAKTDLRNQDEKTLGDLDQQASDLRMNVEKKHSKVEADKLAADLKVKSDAVRKSFDDIGKTTDVDMTKKAIDDKLADYKKALDDAKKRL